MKRRRISAISWVLVAAAVIALGSQLGAALLRGERLASGNVAEILELAAWTVLVLAACAFLAIAIPSRGRGRESRELAERFPNAVVISTSVGADRREALSALAKVDPRLRLPVEMRVVLTSTSLSFWRGDLSRPKIEITGATVTYEVRDYVTLAGRFDSLTASVDRHGIRADLPLFPLDVTSRFLPKPWGRSQLEQVAEKLSGRDLAREP